MLRGVAIKVLIIGGTRFVGKNTVEILIRNGFEVTVLSRNNNILEGSIPVTEERTEGLKLLKGNFYDVIIDFICYEGADVDNVFSNLLFNRYILISTVWLSKIENVNNTYTSLPEQTKKYLLGKKEAEKLAESSWISGIPSIIIRLPILSGVNDHTRRLMFYLDRMEDGYGIIRVNGGNNMLQISHIQDVADAIAKVSIDDLIEQHSLWDAMPGKGFSIKSMLKILSDGKKIQWCDLSEEYLNKTIPEYLKYEPFWREYQLSENTNNIFEITNTRPRPIEEWFLPLKKNAKIMNNNSLRRKEINIIKEL